jgi:methionyl-tRNA formyltransferase
MIDKPDAGDIVGQKAVNIDFNDTARTLYDKLCRAARTLLEEILPLIREGKAPRTPQDLTKGSYFGGRKPEDGRIDWRWPAVRIYNLIRAVTEPYPGAFAFLPGDEKIMIWRAVLEDRGGRNHLPGQIEIETGVVLVGTGQGHIRLLDIEVAGARMKNDLIFNYFKSKKGLILT